MSTRSVIVRLEAEVANYIAGMGRAATATDNVARRVVNSRNTIEQNRAAMDKAGNTMVAFGTVSVAALGASAKAAMDWESAWAGVTKTVDGTPQQMAELEGGLRGLAKTLPITHTELAGVAEAAGQLGVARKDILGFTKTMVDLGVSTNLTAEEAATDIAQISNVMGTMERDGAAGVSRFGAALVALGNDGASTEKDILSMAQRIAGAGATVGATEADVLALSNTLASMGVRAELGGGVATRVLLKMFSAVKDGGPTLDAFAKTAGVSAEEFARAYGESPVHALDMVSQGLNKINQDGGNVVAIMKDLGLKGTEEVQVMLALANSGTLLNDSLKLGAQAWEQNTALVAEATKRYETTDSKVKIAWNNIKDAAIDAGAVILPVIQGVAESVSGLAQTFGSLPKPVQGVITTMAGIIGVSALVGGGALKLIGTVNDLRTAFTRVDAAGSRIPSTFGKIAKGAAIGGAFIGVTTVLAKLAESSYMEKIDTGMGKVNLALQEAANTAPGAANALDKVFQATDGSQITNDVNNLDSALRRTFSKDAGQAFNDWGSTIVHGLTGIKGETQIVGDTWKRLDDGLADMVSNGNAEGAAESFEKIRAAAEKQGVSVDDLVKLFPGYSDALKQAEADAKAAGDGGDKAAGGIGNAGQSSEEAAAKVKEVADALEEIGVNAQGAVTDMVKFTDALLNAGLLTLSARDAARNYNAAIDAVTDSIATNGTTLNTHTEQGRANQAALDGIVSAGFALVKSNAAAGAGEKELQGNLKQTYDDLIANAAKFGITGKAAEDLARDVMKVPKGVKIESWMSAAAKQMAQDTLTALNNVDGKTVHTYSIEHKITSIETQVKGGGSADNPSDTALRPGTLRPSRAGGGDLDMAPGPKGVDSQLFYGAKGEHVFTADEVDKMGGQQAVYRFRAKVRSGEIQALAGGGTVGSRAGTLFSPAAPPRIGMDYDRLAGALGRTGDSITIVAPDKITAKEYFEEAQYQSRARNRGGVHK